MRWNIGPFGVKDLFTLVNLMGGVGAIVFVVEGNLPAAGTALLLGYLLGDTLDGPVARMTKTSNKFGSELDTATDHFVQAIAPAVIVYAAYARGGHATAGVVLMALVVACGTIRQALFSVAKMGDPLMYCGLPRTVSGYGAMAYVLSHLFFALNPARYAVGAVVITAFAAAQSGADPLHDPPRGAADADARPAARRSASWSRPWPRSSSPAATCSTCCSSGCWATRRPAGSPSTPRRSGRFTPATAPGPRRSAVDARRPEAPWIGLTSIAGHRNA